MRTPTVLLLGLAASACGPWTLTPVTAGAPLEAIPGIEGTWISPDGVYHVAATDVPGVYRITAADGEDAAILEGRAMRLEGRLLLETRRHPDGAAVGNYAAVWDRQLFFPMVVDVREDSAWIWTFTGDAFADEEAAGRLLSLGSEYEDISTLIGSPEELRSMLSRAIRQGRLERSDDPLVRVRRE